MSHAMASAPGRCKGDSSGSSGTSFWTCALPAALLACLAREAAAAAGEGRSVLAEVAATSTVLLFTVLGTTFPLVTVALWCCNLGRGWLVSHRAAECAAVWLLWNIYTVTYALFMVPICLFPGPGRWMGGLSSRQLVCEYFLFVTFVPTTPILLSGIFKVAAAKFRIAWRPKYQVAVLLCSLIVAAGGCLINYAVFPGTTLHFVILAAAHFLYLICTTLGEPEVVGSREWPAVRARGEFWGLVLSYLSMRVVGDGQRGGEQGRPEGLGGRDCPARCSILGLHPHGIIPFTMGLMLLHPDWSRALPGWRCPRPMVDAFIHAMPGAKDFMQFFGGLEVSRAALERALARSEAAVLVPGGQAEIAVTRSWGDEVFIDRSHMGFVRLALQHGALLVPLLSMGEWMLMDNVYLPSVQKLSRRILGFPFPFIPFGAFLCMPRRVPITVLVGEPLELPAPKAEGAPTQEEVTAAHESYFARLADMFERRKAECGFPDAKLRFVTRKSG